MAGQARELASAEELQRIAQELYVYAYPLVLMEVTRRVTTNTERPQDVHAPMNQLAHVPQFPDPSFTEVVRPNADTLYSWLWLDVSSEPLVINVPDSGAATTCRRCWTCGPTCSPRRARGPAARAGRSTRSPARLVFCVTGSGLGVSGVVIAEIVPVLLAPATRWRARE